MALGHVIARLTGGALILGGTFFIVRFLGWSGGRMCHQGVFLQRGWGRWTLQWLYPSTSADPI